MDIVVINYDVISSDLAFLEISSEYPNAGILKVGTVDNADGEYLLDPKFVLFLRD